MPTKVEAIYKQRRSDAEKYFALDFTETRDRIMLMSCEASEFGAALNTSLKVTESPVHVAGL